MKKFILYTLALLLAVSCSKESESLNPEGAKGTMKINISATRTETDGEYNPLDHIVVRIFNHKGELVRRYAALTDIPTSLELLAATYRVTVEAGEIEQASFTKRYYQGETTFEILPGQVTTAQVVCKVVNTVADVKFDQTVAENFGTDFYAWVVTADKVDETQAAQGEVPALKFTTDNKGYFTLPEGVTSLAWKFVGEHPTKGPIAKEGVLNEVLPGSKYQITFRFSKDLPGYIEVFTIKVDTSTDDEDDTIIFSPDPALSGENFDIDQRQDFIPGKTEDKKYRVATQAAVNQISLDYQGQSYDLLNGTYDGVTVTRDTDRSVGVVFANSFFAGRAGGEHTLNFHITDVDGGTLQKQSLYRLQGVLPAAKADCDLWHNTVTLRALILEPAVAAVKLALRTKDGAWHEADGVKGADGNYSASFAATWSEAENESGLKVYTPDPGTGIFAATAYEASAEIDGTQSLVAFTSPAGDAIENSGMDLWSTYNVVGSSFTGGSVAYPNQSSNKSFWVGGNNKTTNQLCVSTTIDGSNGLCAQLHPQVAAGNFAAGNLFTGTFECGTGILDMFGYARFGIKYSYSARPRALRVRYNATVGNVTDKGSTGLTTDDVDYARLFVCVTDWTARHSVKSGASFDANTFWDPVKASSLSEGAILGYGSKLVTESTPGWITEEFPIQWYDKDGTPAADNFSLVISFATSYKGDYMGGSTSNYLYVEDIEWVY